MEIKSENILSKIFEEEFNDDEHGDFLGGRLWSIQREADFCDITFIVKQKEFPVHKIIMAASSDYFTAMFKGCFKEETSNKISLEGVDAPSFEQILAYSYIGKLSVNEDIVQNLYGGADMFQYKYIKKVCLEFMLKNVKVVNSIEYLLLAEKHSLSDLKSASLNCIWEHFEEVTNKTKIWELPFKLFHQIIENDHLCCSSETLVLHSICDWIENNPDAVEYEKKMLLEEFRYILLTSSDVNCIYEKTDIIGSASCLEMQRKILQYHMNIREKPLMSTKFSRPRGNTCLVVLGGTTDKNSCNFAQDTMQIFSIGDDGLIKSKEQDRELPGPRTDFATVTIGNYLFLLGGRSINGTVEGTIHRYDPINKVWLQLKSMPTKRYSHAAAVQGCNILVMGGCNISHSQLSSVEQYDIATDTWTKKADLPRATCDLSACTLNGDVYVCSGLMGNNRNLDGKGSTIHQYEPHGDTWLLKTQLEDSCYDRSMCEDGKNIYIFGGTSAIKSCTVCNFNIVVYTSTQTQPMTLCQAKWMICRSGSACIPSNSIFICGGVGVKLEGGKLTGGVIKSCNGIQIYRPKSRKWIESDITLSKALCDCQAEVLVFPHATLT